MVSGIEVRELLLTLMLIAGISGALLVLDWIYPIVSIHLPEHNIFAPQE